MAASKYIRMLRGHDSGHAVEVEYETANYLVAQGQAEEINFDEPGALEFRRVPIAEVTEVRTVSASGSEISIPRFAVDVSRTKRKK